MDVGVIDLQGDVSEHFNALRDVEACPFKVKTGKDLSGADAVVIPGGESTTISSLLFERGIHREIFRFIEDGKPVWGTCAGMVLMGSRGGVDVERSGQRLLGCLDAEVVRNAFGRQKDSFKTLIEFNDFVNPFPAVFIRAPAFKSVGPAVEVLSRLGNWIVAARKGSILATSFHPELVKDRRVHKYFLSL